MKKVAAVLVVLVMLGVAGWAAESAMKGDEVTMTGALSCASCKLAGHVCPKGCCATCVTGGDPALFENEKGDLFLVLSKDMGKGAMTSERMAMLGGKVIIKGILVKSHGLQGIYVDAMEKVADAKPAEKK
jgi:hypothetical protein